MTRVTHRAKADLYLHLAALERAGMPQEQAFRTLAREAAPGARKPLELAGALVGRGRSLGVIGVHTGLFDRLDAEIVKAASVAGKVEQAYQRLAERHRKADSRQRRVRGKLMLPALVLGLAAFVRPFPAFFSGALDLSGYLGAALGPILLVAAGGVALPRLWRLIASTAPGRPLQGLAGRLPLVGRLESLRNRCIYLDALALLVEAGVPALRSLAIAADLVPSPRARAAFERVRAQVEAGKPLHRAFAACPWMDGRSTRLLAAGEASGTLGDTLTRIADFARADLDGLEDAVATWMPRVAYIAVALWILSGISPTAFVPQVPGDL